MNSILNIPQVVEIVISFLNSSILNIPHVTETVNFVPCIPPRILQVIEIVNAILNIPLLIVILNCIFNISQRTLQIIETVKAILDIPTTGNRNSKLCSLHTTVEKLVVSLCHLFSVGIGR